MVAAATAPAAAPSPAPAALDWRCPRCSNLCSRLAVSRLAPGEWIEIKCRCCNKFSTAEGGVGGVVVRKGRHDDPH